MKIIVLLLGAFTLWGCQDRPSEENRTTLQHTLKIAYNVGYNLEKDDYEIFLMELDGSNRKNITQNPDVAWTYLAGEQKVYFISDRDTCFRCYYLYEIDLSGQQVKRITDFQLRDSWMGSRKKGKEIIVNPKIREGGDFYIINVNGEIIHKIVTGLTYASDPTFSPDGLKIAFRGAHQKSKREDGFVDEIYLIDHDGKNLTQLSHYPESDTSAAWYAYKSGPPRWHPTENFISFQTFRNGKYSLYAVSPDGERQWKLLDLVENEGWHDWSFDGRFLAIELFDSTQTQFHIGLINWPSKDWKIITDTVFQYQQAPVFVVIPDES